MIREWKDSTIKRFLKEGRGSGEGSEYKSWLQVQDINSQGRSTRTYSYKSQRVIHLLSDLQLYYWYLLEFDDMVLDVREQFPLLDFHEMNIPVDQELEKKLFSTKTNVPHVFIVSFMVTRIDQNGNSFYEARAIKSSTELTKKATIERLEMQRRYFEKKQIDFGVVTEMNINKQLARNIGWVLTAYDIQDYPDLVRNFLYLKEDLLHYLSNHTATFQMVFQRIEKDYQLDEGLGLILFKHLVATKQIKFDLNRKIDMSRNVEEYRIELPGIKSGGDKHAVNG
ncbi:TnsA endonuclease N-terminal domain-containing protein [Robertmurraya sp. DFI.2.37]|uniref:TnsA endonuclease C-terminal domain-containing protein n=1 Tax=Robertmurraya sp. DFI.2.37 TaxID=3031819 RepID=UPI0012443C92|nr:TnsA endonuclease C-terminal domain-containing protein [Robertmurraya sp. DFI.2.37]MDF1511265.1 TnsA endonuclease N-terminal domain-containing protein [Robertmurraya sp. DFI.2.37]